MQTNFIFDAIESLVPGAGWTLCPDGSEKNLFEQIKWTNLNGREKPTQEQIEKAIEKCKSNIVPFKKLRSIRDQALSESDWVVVKSIEKQEPIPQEWKEYRQKLRDLPKTETPEIDEYGNLNLKKINLPQKPL